jgi:MraZ protein
MLIGEFDSKITENSRIALPKKFREELGKELIVMNGYEGCLIVVDKNKFLALTKDITEGRFVNDAIRDTMRFLIGSAHEIMLDKQGRFVLPQSLIDFSKLKTVGVFLGLYNWIELWDKDLWQDRKNHIQGNAEAISAKLNENFNENKA